MACQLCATPKDTNTCGACGGRVCKNCVVFNPPERYRFHPAPPAPLRHEIFCANCFERDAAPLLAHYDEVLDRAREVTVVSKAFRGPVPTLRRARARTAVEEHLDAKDAVQHLQFLAAWEGFDSVVGLETESRKERNHGYESKRWKAAGLFALLDRRRFRPEG